MAKKTKLFKRRERKSRAEVSEFLGQLSQKIADGQVVLRAQPNDLVLPIPHSLAMGVKINEKHKRVKGLRHKLSITLTWYEDDNQEGPLVLG